MQQRLKLLTYIAVTACSLAIIFGLATVFVPGFGNEKYLVIGAIFGGLTTIAATIGGTLALTNLEKKSEDETR